MKKIILMKFPLFIIFISLNLFSNEILSFSEVKKNFKKSDVKILDRSGKLLNELRVNSNFRTTNWLSIEEISSNIIKALVIAEDKNFYDHSGVDYFALLKGFFSYISFVKKRGASTISMQLVSFLNKELASKKSGRSFKQKWNQIFEALELEKNWTKDEILEAYLNLAPFKGELIGIDSASRAVFKKEAHGLTEIESSILVSFFKSPSGNEIRIKKRACYIYEKLKENSCEEINSTVEKVFQTKLWIKPKNNLAFHIKTKLENSNIDILTSLDFDYQKKAEDLVKNHIQVLKSKNVNDAALILLDNKSGEVRAYVGSIDKEVDGVIANRQAGSTLKPFLYAKAFEENLLTDSSILEDKPIEIQVGSGIYAPNNYKDKFFGDVSVRQALASSLNIPAIKVYKLLNEGEFLSLLESLGFSNSEEEEFYGPSIALGSIDVSLKDLTNAYRVFANEGNYSQTIFFKNQQENKKIFTTKTTNLITSILSDKEARALTFGLNNPLVTKFSSAVKTGTSKDMRDNWCVGYNEKFTLGVWVGNFNGEPMRDVSGVTGAAPIWRSMINYLDSNNFEKIQIKNKQTDIQEKLEPDFTIKIISPVKNAIYGIDPEIPEEISAIFLETNIKSSEYQFYLNEKPISDTSMIRYLKPKKGIQKLKLVDKYKKVIDEVQFEIR